MSIKKKSLPGLFELRQTLQQLEEDLGMGELHDIDRLILEFIGYCEAKGRLIVSTQIEHEPMFASVSRPTIYRSLKRLREQKRIVYETDVHDGRVRYVFPVKI
jgi:DNA-binding PadR family transcriptional regulator